MDKRKKVASASEPKAIIFLYFTVFLVSFFSLLSANMANIDVRREFLDYDEFPEGYSLFSSGNEKTYETFVDTNFAPFPHYEIEYGTLSSEETNVESPECLVKVYGLKESEIPPYVPSPYRDDSLIPFTLKAGNLLSHGDFVLGLGDFLTMDSSFAVSLAETGGSLKIKGSTFALKGVMDQCHAAKRSQKPIVPIWVSKATFETFFPPSLSSSDLSYSLECVAKTDSYDFESQSAAPLQSYRLIKREEEQKLKTSADERFSLTIGLMAISSIAIVIIQTLYVKGRDEEIGIRRAIGASRFDIVADFGGKSLAYGLFGLSSAIFLSALGSLLYGVYCSVECYAPLLFFDWSASLTIIGLYGLVFVMASLIPLILAAHINISEVLVEER